MRCPRLVVLLVFSMFAAIAGEVTAQATPDSTSRRLNQVFVKVIVPVTSRTPKQKGPVVESWVAKQLKQLGETEYFAVTDWVPVCDGLLEDDAIDNRVWDGRLKGNHPYCPVSGDITKRKDCRLLVNVGGWLPGSGCEANIALPDEPGSRAVAPVQILLGKESKPMKTEDPLPYVAVIITPPLLKGGLDAQKEKPKFFTSQEITSADLAKAVNYFVNLGEKESAIALAEIANKHTFSGKIDLAFRVACVCRILWKNTDNPVVPPRLGMYGGGVSIDPRNQSELKEWPLFPVAKSGVSYFIVVNRGRGGTGQSGNLKKEYIQQCQDAGTFLTEKITVPTAQQFQADAELLRDSDRWSREFPGSSGESIWLSIQLQSPKIVQ